MAQTTKTAKTVKTAEPVKIVRTLETTKTAQTTETVRTTQIVPASNNIYGIEVNGSGETEKFLENFYPMINGLEMTTVYTDKSTGDGEGNYGCGQGSTSDGERYIYYANWHNNDNLPTTLKKYDIYKNEIVLTNSNKSYHHANGMAYCNADGKVYIAHSKGAVWIVSVVDPETLECEREIDLYRTVIEKMPEDERNEILELDNIDGKWSACIAIGYDNTREKFLLMDRHEQHRIICCDKNMNYEKMLRFDVPTYPARQGVFSDEFYIYTIYWDDKTLTNYIYAWDWDANLKWYLKVDGTNEIEGATIIGDSFYFTFNTHGAIRYITVVKAYPTEVTLVKNTQ